MATEPAERLLNLIIALTRTRGRMTRAQIRASVVGYEPASTPKGEEETRKAEAAFERMFERDKDELRRMGIPLRTVIDPTHGDEIGYRIDASDAAMPAIDFTPAEAASLAVAADYWGDAVFAADARQGLTKIASTTRASAPTPLTMAARASATSDAFAVIIDARARRAAVSFEYSSATAGLSKRTVEPWQIVVRGRAEYLVGFDRDRQAQRMFRLRRIHGKVAVTGPDGAYVVPEPLPELNWGDTGLTEKAVVALLAESGYALRARGQFVETQGEWDLFEVSYRYADTIRDEVLSLGGRACVVSPSSLADDVMAWTAAAIALEGGDGHE